MRLLLDQGLPRSAGNILTRHGHDTVHTGDCDLFNASDMEIIEFARKEGRIVVTLDSDFHTILAVTNATGPSIIRIRVEGLRAERLAELILKVLTQESGELTNGSLVSVTENQIRLHRLPIVPER